MQTEKWWLDRQPSDYNHFLSASLRENFQPIPSWVGFSSHCFTSVANWVSTSTFSLIGTAIAVPIR